MATLLGHDWLQVTINGIADNLGFLENLRDGNVGKSMKKLTEKIDVIRVAIDLMTEDDLSDKTRLEAYQRRMKKLY